MASLIQVYSFRTSQTRTSRFNGLCCFVCFFFILFYFLRTEDGQAPNGCEAQTVCSAVEGGTCSECTTLEGCTSVVCAANFFNSDDDASNGCEETCPVIDDGNCEACSAPDSCTSLSCNPGFVESESGGCEEEVEEEATEDLAAKIANLGNDNDASSAFIEDLVETAQSDTSGEITAPQVEDLVVEDTSATVEEPPVVVEPTTTAAVDEPTTTAAVEDDELTTTAAPVGPPGKGGPGKGGPGGPGFSESSQAEDSSDGGTVGIAVGCAVAVVAVVLAIFVYTKFSSPSKNMNQIPSKPDDRTVTLEKTTSNAPLATAQATDDFSDFSETSNNLMPL